jgi:LysM repeat protein
MASFVTADTRARNRHLPPPAVRVVRTALRAAAAAAVGAAVVSVAGALWSPASADTARVAPGDTLSSLAARYHTTVAALRAANNITNPNFLLIGTVLQIPGPSSPVTSPAASASTLATGTPVSTTVVVRSGDTLSSIASHYHTTVGAIVSANHLVNANFVLIGTRLVVPIPPSALGAYLAPLPSGSPPADAVRTKLLAHPDRLALRLDFVRSAAASGLPANLLEGMCWWESGWQNSATSSTGAIGVCQIEPSTVDYVRTKLLHNSKLDPRIGADNIAMSAAYLHDLIVRAGGDVNSAVAGYYQGLPSVQRGQMVASTPSYVKGVLGYAAIFPPGG